MSRGAGRRSESDSLRPLPVLLGADSPDWLASVVLPRRRSASRGRPQRPARSPSTRCAPTRSAPTATRAPSTPVDRPAGRRRRALRQRPRPQRRDAAVAREHPHRPPADRARRARQRRLPLPGEPTTTLATLLKARGYRTGAFVSAFPLDSRFGLARGFDVYDDRFVDARRGPRSSSRNDAARETVALPRPLARRAATATRRGSAGCTSTSRTCRTTPPEPSPRASPASRTTARSRRPTRRSRRCSQPILAPARRGAHARRRHLAITASRSASTARRPTASSPTRRRCRVPLVALPAAACFRPRDVERRRLRHVDSLPTMLDALGAAGRHPASPAAACCRRGRRSSSDARRDLLRGAVGVAQPRLGAAARRLSKANEVHRAADARALRPAARSRASSATWRRREPQRRRRAARALLRDVGRGDVTRAAETPEARERLRALGYSLDAPGGAGEAALHRSRRPQAPHRASTTSCRRSSGSTCRAGCASALARAGRSLPSVRR